MLPALVERSYGELSVFTDFCDTQAKESAMLNIAIFKAEGWQ
jgi:hypothetical protein